MVNKKTITVIVVAVLFGLLGGLHWQGVHPQASPAGQQYAGGSNSQGQLDDGTTENSGTPLQVSGLIGVVAIAAGGDHNLALKIDGTVWAWGRNDEGQLGDGTTTSSNIPVQISSLIDFVAISAGGPHSLAITSRG